MELSHEDFMKEFNKRVENKYLNHIYNIRAKSKDPREFQKIPVEILMETFKGGASTGIKILSEMVKEGLT